MNEFLTFRKMITPLIIQILFWVFVVIVVIGGIVALKADALRGILMIVLGPVIVRIYCEILIVLFRILESLQEIAMNTGGKAGAEPAPGSEMPQAGQF